MAGITDTETNNGRTHTTGMTFGAGRSTSCSVRARLPLRAAAILAAALAAVLVSTAPAMALSQRGHEFAFSFGSSGEGGLSDPGGVAVSEMTGDVYVLDRGHYRIVQYAPERNGKGKITGYKFASAWGWGVKKGSTGKEYEECAAGECNLSGISGTGKYQFNANVQAIAVDNCRTSEGKTCTEEEDPSVGDVYVAKEAGKNEKETIVKFSSSGNPLEKVSKVKYREGAGKEASTETEELEAEDTYGLTVALHGTVWLNYDEELYSLSDKGLAQKDNPPPLTFTFSPGKQALGLAVDAREHFYIAHQGESTDGEPLNLMSEWEVIENESGQRELEELGGGEELTEGLDYEDTSAVAVNPMNVAANEVDEQNDVYITNVATKEGREATTVAQFGPNDELIQRFGASGLNEGAGIAVDPASGGVYVTDAQTGDVDLFALEEPGPATVDSASVEQVTSESAKLEAQIDPDGAVTTYVFEYGTAPCAEDPTSCVKVEGVVPGGGYGDEAVDTHLQRGTGAPVLPGTTYHYRVRAGHEPDTSESEREGVFTTLPATANGGGIADERVWEMVSEREKGGALIEALTGSGGAIQASSSGDAITYVSNGPIGEADGNRSLEDTQMLSSRGPDGWGSQDITTPNEHGTGLGTGIGDEYRFFAEDLSLALVRPFLSLGNMAEPPLSPPVSAREEELEEEGKDYQQSTLYLRDDAPLAPAAAEAENYHAAQEDGVVMSNPGYLALVDDANVLPGAEFGSEFKERGHELSFLDATPSLSTSVVSSNVAGPPSCTFGLLGCTPGLYEWTAGELRLVNLLEDGAVAEHAELGYGAPGANSSVVRHAISNDGSRVFWGYEGHLYLRDLTKGPEGETVRLDKARGVAEPPGPTGEAKFQTASADGSRVFFTDGQRLVTGAGATPERPDLYVCEVVENASHELECELTDLTPEHETPTHEKESANVQGLVLGASETGCDESQEGCYVYFVADGALSEAANAEGEKAAPGLCGVRGYPDRTCNLYVEHYGGEPGNPGWPKLPTFIARLSSGDELDWMGLGASKEAPKSAFTSRVSPNGRYLAFMSERELTGYDNVDSSAEAKGAHDEEVFLYEASPGHLVCASCDPSGARPTGILDPPKEDASGKTIVGPEGSGLLVDRPRVWAGRWLAGSIPGWTLLHEKGETEPYSFYQSRYLSNSGRLFFDSPEALVPQDTNGKEDVYEYEPAGVPQGPHECTSASATHSVRSEGCVGLISSGTSDRESAFLDASEAGGEGEHGEELSEGGGDVFFVTAAPLVPQDTDTSFDVYDAHECTGASPCIVPPEERTPTVCEATEACRPYSYSAPASGNPGSVSPPGPGNIAPKQNVLPIKIVKPKPLTRAQKLANALKACRRDFGHARRKRAACEASARRKYGPIGKQARGRTSSVHGTRGSSRGAR